MLQDVLLVDKRSSVGTVTHQAKAARHLLKLSAGLSVNVFQIEGRDTFAKQRLDSSVHQFPQHIHHCCSRLRTCSLHEPRRNPAFVRKYQLHHTRTRVLSPFSSKSPTTSEEAAPPHRSSCGKRCYVIVLWRPPSSLLLGSIAELIYLAC